MTDETADAASKALHETVDEQARAILKLKAEYAYMRAMAHHHYMEKLQAEANVTFQMAQKTMEMAMRNASVAAQEAQNALHAYADDVGESAEDLHKKLSAEAAISSGVVPAR